MRLMSLALMCLLSWGAAGADLFRYAEPALGRLVFNQVLTDTLSAPLRLPKVGEYYAELILEPADGQQDVALSAPLSLAVELNVARREHALLKRIVNVSFAPGERSKTLLWLNAPDHLPTRTNLELEVSVRDAGNTQPNTARLRLQLTRKFEFAPLIVR
ncbi:MAG: hypothetical protein IPM80_09685 [Proteobacteria bacterium]|nr:hypothetical protein [Pseudomonadota bacterium]